MSPPPPRALRVLLADDHAPSRKMVEAILGSIGVLVISVETGEGAVEAFQADGFDLVLMDLQMPVLDGLAAIRAMRALEARGGIARTQIFALTANAMAVHIEASRLAGADAHLTKPISPGDLIAAVREAGRRDRAAS